MPSPIGAPHPVGHNHNHGGHGVHGMVAFGGPAGLFLSHIPMMQAPHALQVGLRVGPPPGQQFNDGLYTFVPEPFDKHLAKGMKFSFGAKNTLENAKKLKAGQQLEVTLERGRKVKVKVERVLSLLVGPDFTP